MKNRKLLLIVSIVLALTMSLGSTLAYLTDTDADVNVMVVGNVQIVQNEQQRNEAGELVEFVQDKPLLPAVYTGDSIPWDPTTEGNQAWKFVEKNVNVLDKIVTVTNKGNTPAYVRTLVAFEGSEEENGILHIISNGPNVEPAIDVQWFKNVEIQNETYLVGVYTYPSALGAQETTIPSLKQVYLDKTADNDDVKSFGETYDILVISQAVQATGFGEAATALNAGFNNGEELKTEHVKGFFEALYNDDGSINEDMIGTPGDKWPSNNPPSDDVTVVKTVEDLKTALEAGENVILADDIELDGDALQQMDSVVGATAQSMFSVIGDKEVTIDLNGKTIYADTAGGTNVWSIFYAGQNANLTVKNGRIEYNSEGRSAGTAAFTTYGSNSVITIEGVEVEQIGEGGVTQMIYAHGATNDLGKIYVQGGTYIQKQPNSATNPFYEQGGLNTNIIVSGGTYKVYHDVDLTQYMTLADGYKLELVKTDDDGAKWYTVVKE